MYAKEAWMPAIDNVATVMCFAICLILNVMLDKTYMFVQIYPKLKTPTFLTKSTVTSFIIMRMYAKGAWMPAVNNVATVMCFAMCLILNVMLDKPYLFVQIQTNRGGEGVLVCVDFFSVI